MYALITNYSVEKYPYSFNQLIGDNPQTSFPANPSDETLAEWGMFPVTAVSRPDVDHTKNVTETDPELTGGKWTQVWVVSDASPNEVEQRTNNQAASVRAERNSLIAECDWTQLPDSPLTTTKKQEWSLYRQTLRDITSQPVFPWNVVWPNKPE
jgi:hypothetical protein